MMSKLSTLKGYKLCGLDGELGSIREFLFDDRDWNVRYLVVETGNWLMSRKVLLSLQALTFVSNQKLEITFDLTKKSIEDSPAFDPDIPITRAFEESLAAHFGWPAYWASKPTDALNSLAMSTKRADSLVGDTIQASDGPIGRIDDFIVDDEAWILRYLIVDTKKWLPGKQVLVSPMWIDQVMADESKVFVGLTQEQIRLSPEYPEISLPSREYEIGLYRHYDRPGYWQDKSPIMDLPPEG